MIINLKKILGVYFTKSGAIIKIEREFINSYLEISVKER